MDDREINNKGVRLESPVKELKQDGAEGLGISLRESKAEKTGPTHRYEPPNVVSVVDTSDTKIRTPLKQHGLAGGGSLAPTETALD